MPVIPLILSGETPPAEGGFVRYETTITLKGKADNLVVAVYDPVLGENGDGAGEGAGALTLRLSDSLRLTKRPVTSAPDGAEACSQGRKPLDRRPPSNLKPQRGAGSAPGVVAVNCLRPFRGLSIWVELSIPGACPPGYMPWLLRSRERATAPWRWPRALACVAKIEPTRKIER